MLALVGWPVFFFAFYRWRKHHPILRSLFLVIVPTVGVFLGGMLLGELLWPAIREISSSLTAVLSVVLTIAFLLAVFQESGSTLYSGQVD